MCRPGVDQRKLEPRVPFLLDLTEHLHSNAKYFAQQCNHHCITMQMLPMQFREKNRQNPAWSPADYVSYTCDYKFAFTFAISSSYSASER